MNNNRFNQNVFFISEDYNKYIMNFFSGDLDLFNKLKSLNEKKEEIRLLKSQFGKLSVPIVITVSGTPRAGKTTCIDNLFEFFKKADLKTVCVEEPAGIIYSKLKTREEKKILLSDRVKFVEQQWDVGYKSINEGLIDNDIIICDRGVIDTFIWYTMYYKLGMIDDKKYNDYFERIKELKKYYNHFYALFTDSFESMRRDYINSLSIEPRTTMNQENVDLYNSSMMEILPNIKSSIENTTFIDTTKCDRMYASIKVANDVLDDVKKLYLRRG